MAELKNLIVNGVARVNGDAYVSDMIYGTASHAISASWAPMPSFTDTDRYVATASFASTGSNGANGVKMTLTRRGSDTGTVVSTIPVATATAAGVVSGAQVSSWNGVASTASNAYRSASAALATASIAKGYAESASTYASQAQTYRNSASSSASKASGWSTSASNYAAEASGSMEDARFYSAQAATNATLASTYAIQASASANIISASTVDAQRYATNASASASLLYQAVGSATQPVYMTTAGPTAATAYADATVKTANSVSVAAVNTNANLPLFFAAAATPANPGPVKYDTNLTYNASTNRMNIPQVSSTGVTASGAFRGALIGNVTGNLTGTASFAISASRAVSAASADSTTTATKLVGTSGSTSIPVYVNAGVPTVCSGTVVSTADRNTWTTASNRANAANDGLTTPLYGSQWEQENEVPRGAFKIVDASGGNVAIDIQDDEVPSQGVDNYGAGVGTKLSIWGGLILNVAGTVEFYSEANASFVWSENSVDIETGGTYEFNCIQYETGGTIYGIITKYSES